jgi:hypothetical protein
MLGGSKWHKREIISIRWSILEIAEFIQTKYERLHNENLSEGFYIFLMIGNYKV